MAAELVNASRDCTCGETANGVPLPELLGEGWKVWYRGWSSGFCDTYMTCPECSVTIARLERAAERGTLIS
jgi:hypothetical protein